MTNEKPFWGSLIGFFTVSLMGVVAHFLFELSGNNTFIGLFTPVNESTWEHLKLLFFPFMLYNIIEFLTYGKKIQGFLFSRVTGVIFGLIFIPLAHFLYTSILGKSFATIDILLFFISVFLAFYISYSRIVKKSDQKLWRTFSALILFTGISALFIGLTFFPPDTALFRSPV